MEKWIKRVAIVTGSNSGNGYAILKKFAEAGIVVVGLDVKTDIIDEFKADNSELQVHAITCDVTNNDETENAFQWVEDQLGGVDILVNNAGMLRNVGLLEYQKPMSEMAYNVDLNFTAYVRCARLAFKSMEVRDAYGYIININSIHGHFISKINYPQARTGVYSSTKFAITAATEVMRSELLILKNKKVRITSVSPGLVKTNLLNAIGFPKRPYPEEILVPEDIGNTVAYLLSVPYHISIHEIIIRATGATD